MHFKKMKNKPFGVKFTTDEQKAMDAEINRQLADHLEAHKKELIAAVLWDQHMHLGFGPERLKRSYMRLYHVIDDVIACYRSGIKDPTTRHIRILKHYGIDLDKWEEEICIWDEET